MTPTKPIECGSEEGITIGLLDTICNCLHILKDRDISSPAIASAIDDTRTAVWRCTFMEVVPKKNTEPLCPVCGNRMHRDTVQGIRVWRCNGAACRHTIARLKTPENR